MGPGSHVGFPISAKNKNLLYDHPMNISAKFDSNLFCGLWSYTRFRLIFFKLIDKYPLGWYILFILAGLGCFVNSTICEVVSHFSRCRRHYGSKVNRSKKRKQDVIAFVNTVTQFIHRGSYAPIVTVVRKFSWICWLINFLQVNR
jgi:hypothetical protein